METSRPAPLRVLVVEDSELDAIVLINVLRAGGYKPDFKRVETSTQMNEALEEDWDVILADYNLPEFSAPEALKILQASPKDIPFLIISGGIGEDVAVGAMKSGAHDYLMKGSLARLVPAVDREIREAHVRESRKRAESALRESEQRYRLLWETATDAVLLMDSNSTIHFANPAVQSVFGYQPAEIIGQNLTLLLPDRVRSGYEKDLNDILRSGIHSANRHVLETVGLRKEDQEVLIEIVYNDMKLHDERWYVAFIRDITARKEAEKEIQESRAQFELAHEIQQRLYPVNTPADDHLDVAGISIPADTTGAGGDYYDYLPMLNDKWGFVVGDVTGHGVGPAMIMAETRAYLRILARNRNDPGIILSRVNHVLCEDLDTERYVTLFLAVMDPETGQFSYASAGHTPGFLIGKDGTLRGTLKRTGVPLGMNPKGSYDTSANEPLESGDILVLTTDGIDETINSKEEFYGRKRIAETVAAHCDKSAQEIVDALLKSARDFADGEPQDDDLTVIILKVK